VHLKTWFLLLFLALNATVPSKALGETHNVGVFLESNGAETSQTLAYTYSPNTDDHANLYWGLSFSGVQSDESLAPNNRSEIIAYNIILGYRANYFISPYAELGVDLGDLFIDTIISGESEEVDITGSIGLVFNAKVVDVYLYYKSYSIKYSESDVDNGRVSTNRFAMPGIGIGFKF